MGDALLPPTKELEMVEEGQEEGGPESVTTDLNGHTLQQMLGLLVRIACSAAGLDASNSLVGSTGGHTSSSTKASTGGVAPDVVVYVVREALATLGTLLESHPELYDALLSNPW
jgi:hypothetical protein